MAMKASKRLWFATLFAIGLFTITGELVAPHKSYAGTQGTIVPTSQFKPFIAPKGEDLAFKEYGAIGQLLIVGYIKRGNLTPMYPSPFMRTASTAYVVAKDSSGKQIEVATIASAKDSSGHSSGVIHIPMWFSAENTWYGVVENDYNRAVTSVYQFTPSATSSLGWTVRKFIPKSFNGQLLFKVGNRLLVRSWGIGHAPIWYLSFTRTGLETHSITQPWPKPGSIPNSVTVTVHEFVSRTGSVTLQEPSVVHVRVGQTIVMRILGDHSVPITPLFYSDTSGDPGDGSLTTRLASPYTDAMMYRVVATSRHGLAAMTFKGGYTRITIVSTAH